MIDLYFTDHESRSIEYNARDSVDDFDACMMQYRELARRAKSSVPGIYDLHYGMGADERLDLFSSPTQSAPLFVFIHGGYWHSQRKEDACSMAESLTRHGVSLATIEYTLLPEATLSEAVREVRSAISWLYHNSKRYGFDPERIFVGGSSAGAHLAGMLIADDWQRRYQAPANVVKGALLLSGLYDIRPLCDIYVNAWMRLTPDQAMLLSPLHQLPSKANAPRILIDVGAKETRGFRNQTLAYYQVCQNNGFDVRFLEDTENNHFTLVNELANPESRMFGALMRMVNG